MVLHMTIMHGFGAAALLQPPAVGWDRCARSLGRHGPARAMADGSPYDILTPYKEAAYDPAAAETFFGERPLAVARRLAQLATVSGGFVVSTIVDKMLKREERLVEERSQQLLEVVTKLGPTFIKVCNEMWPATVRRPIEQASLVGRRWVRRSPSAPTSCRHPTWPA